MQEHEYSELLRAIARGEAIQSLNMHKVWEDISAKQTLIWIANRKPAVLFRIKPKTIRIGEYDVPEPMREAPEIGYKYFRLDFDRRDHWMLTWADDKADKIYLKNGLVFKTAEDVKIARDAILSLLKKETK